VELVATHLDKSLAEVNRVIADRIARARTEYEHKYGTLDDVHVQSIVRSVEGAYGAEGYENQLAECPACGNLGMLSGGFDVDWEADFDRDGTPTGAYPIVTLTPSTFDCHHCNLELNGAGELKAAGFGDQINIEDVDPSDFYDAPEY